MKAFYCNGKKGICYDYNNDVCHCCDFCDGTEGYEIEDQDNPYWQRITALADKQRAKGMSKYGVGLEDNTANATERVRHIQEELIDALMYLTWLEESLKEGEADDQ